jgi:two-component system chemotaxis response regulator CheY
MRLSARASIAKDLSVLVVDDDIDMARLIAALLHDMGASRVDRAKDGGQALQKIQQDADRYNLIISDWEMPKVDGLTLLRTVRQIRPELPFLMLTVRTGSEAILAAKNACVTAYISKPFRPRELQRKILSIVSPPAAEAVQEKEDVFFIC